ncbi:MAG: endospore germination permease [Clostridiales bacterium]|nr:endospore germination permease [Clostridiales bacterium]
MHEEGKFGVQEAVWLCVCAITAKLFFTSPAVIAAILGPSGWFMPLLSGLIALACFALIVVLLRRFPGRGLTEIYEVVFGQILGSVVSALLGAYLIYLLFQNISEFQEVLHLYVLRNSPDWFIISAFVISMVIISFFGLEGLVRTAKIFSFFIVAGFLTLLFLASGDYNTSNIFPILGFGIQKTLVYAVLRSSTYGEVIILTVFAGSLQGTDYVKKAGLTALIISGAISTLSFLAYVLSFPFYISQEVVSPMYELSQMIDRGRFLQRIEPIFLFLWVITTLISCTAIFYTSVSIYCRIFRIRDRRPIIVGWGIITLFACLIESNISGSVYMGIQTIRQVGSIPFFAVPIFTLVISLLRKKRDGAHEKK